MSIQFGRVVLILSFVSPCMVFSPDAVAQQDPPVNASLRSHWDGFTTGSYADIWADGNFVYIGRFGSAGVEIIDISTPDSVISVGPYLLPSVHASASAQDVKVANGLLFVGLEGTPNAGIHIADVRDPTNPVPLVDIDILGFNQIHNVFYDQGFLYFADSGTPRVGIVDLTTFDPDNPPASNITTTKWIIHNVGTSFVHDMTVQNGRLYVAAWDSGLWVYAVDQVATTAPALLGTAAGNNTHSCWPTADGRFVVTAEERGGGGIKVYQITGSGATFALTFRDGVELTSTGQANSVHNPVVVGNRVYCSWYQAGLQVFDINPSNGALSLVASFDTSPLANDGGFSGNWGVYPLLGPDRICLSDLSAGLFVVDVSRSVGISFPNGLPDAVMLGEPTDIDVLVIGLSDTVVSNSPTLHYRFDGGGFLMTPLVPVSGNLFRATLPAASCGDTPVFFFTAKGVSSGLVSEPSDAPSSTFKSEVGVFALAELLDDFETDTGWIVSDGGATDGQWERGIPAGGGRGNPTVDADGSGQAYVTGNRGGSSDVDGGATVLTSPPFDVAAGQWITYSYWLNGAPDLVPPSEPDTLTVEVATDTAGENWQLVRTYGVVEENWRTDRIEIGNEAPASTALRLRFTATDEGPATTIEAGVDAVRIQEVQCGGSPDCTIPRDDDVDGVCNDVDACPGTAVNDPVDGNGCSTADDDGDGVLNDQDACNATPTCATVDADGCEGDSDGDGVADGCDLCPGTALNDAVDGDGCPTTTDAGSGDLPLAFETCPEDVTIPATSAAGIAFHVAVPSVPSISNATGKVTITVNPALGTVFPVGTTAVTFTASDESGKSVTCEFNVTVIAPGSTGDPAGLVIQNQNCGCGNGVAGVMMLPMMWIGIRRMRRRRGMRKTRDRH